MNDIRIPLTANQELTLNFISQFVSEKGYPPTINEIQRNLGYWNPGYVHKVLSSLEKKGYIVKKKGEHRSIRLTELSKTLSSSAQLSFLNDRGRI